MGHSVYVHDVTVPSPSFRAEDALRFLQYQDLQTDERNFVDPGGYQVHQVARAKEVSLPTGLDADRVFRVLHAWAIEGLKRFEKSVDPSTPSDEAGRLLLEPHPIPDPGVAAFFRMHADKWGPAVAIRAGPTRWIICGVTGG